jgi:hypothetical protein
MSIKITITEEEISNTPNDFELGKLIRQKYFKMSKNEEYDTCIQCGKKSPYLVTTHIDFREGYIEGVGQTCFTPNVCKK